MAHMRTEGCADRGSRQVLEVREPPREDYDEFKDPEPLKPRTKAYAEARKRVGAAMAKVDASTREELTLCARLANRMGDKESAHVLALQATKTRPATGTAPGFD